MKTDLAKFVHTDLSSARLARLWDRVAPRLAPAPAPSRKFVVRAAVVGGLVLAVGAGAALVTERSPDSSTWEHAVFETAGDRLSMNLGEGSSVELAAATRVEVTESNPSALQLRLGKGSVLCDVAHQPRRRFSVFAGGVEVRVVGTRFRVSMAENAEVGVEVERGTVEITVLEGSEPPRRLSAGERWSMLPRVAQPAVAAPLAAAAVAAPLGAELPVSGRASQPASDGGSADLRDRAKQGAAPPADSAAADPSARQLFDSANAARRAGNWAGAVSAYELLLSRYPRDERAGLVAFELGRLRLERLNNPASAVQAFERAIASAPEAGLRGDAMARLVDAYAALGNANGAKERCAKAKQAYLNRYPTGVHAATIKTKCVPR